MRDDISKATNGLTISAGIATNRMLAKIASDFNKPNGQYTIEANADKIKNFMGKLGIRKIPGIGKVTEHIIKEVLGCTRVHEMLEPEKMLRLYQLFTVDVANFLVKSSLGISNNKHDDSIKMGPSQKGISNERTFKELSSKRDLYNMVESLSKSLSEQMQAKELKGKTITLKLKTSNFEVKTRATTILTYTNDPDIIIPHVKKLLDKEMPIKLRLMGIRVNNFKGKSEPIDRNQKQLSTFFFKQKKQSNNDNNISNTTTTNNIKDDGDGNIISTTKSNIMDGGNNINIINNNNFEVPNANQIRIKNHLNLKPTVSPSNNIDENYIICEKCKKKIKLCDLFEHEDWHVAREVKRKFHIGGSSSSSSSSSSSIGLSSNSNSKRRKKGKKKMDGQQSIFGFLQRK